MTVNRYVSKHASPVVGLLLDTIPAGVEPTKDQLEKYFRLRSGELPFYASKSTQADRHVVRRSPDGKVLIIPMAPKTGDKSFGYRLEKEVT